MFIMGNNKTPPDGFEFTLTYARIDTPTQDINRILMLGWVMSSHYLTTTLKPQDL